MCGISGISNLQDPSPIEPEILRRMTFALRHRGPDETGAYLDEWVGLAQSRLSIIDLRGGSQPIHNEDSTLWIIFNGEIFNYPELREQLLSRGHKFKTNTDTEVILHLYEDKQEESLKELNGQFAIAIWDTKNKELFLARDRLGILPLYYKIEKNKLIFASEIKSIIEASEQRTCFDALGIEQIYTFWTNLPGRTSFNNINELPPGCYIKVKGGKISLNKYWEIPINKAQANDEINLELISEQIKELLIDAIRIRLRADVPVACYLSGGLDSSIITSLVRRNFKNELRTFGISFQDKDYDESSFQKLLASFSKINYTEVFIKDIDIGKHFRDSIYYTERPVFRSAPVPFFLLSQEVREHNYKVVLTGEGADEVFGGYDIFCETKARKFWSCDPNSHIRPKLLKKLYPYIFKDKRISNTVEAFFKQGIEDPENIFFSHLIRWSNTSKLKNFFSDDLKSKIGDYDAYEDLKNLLPDEFSKQDAVSKAQYLEILTFMSGYLLSSQGDRMSMANSVEIRVPFLDHRIIELLAHIPSRYKIRGMNEKYLLKKAFHEILPTEILYRKKNPYRAPIHKSLIDNPFLSIDNFLSKERIEEVNVFDFKKVNFLNQKAKKFGSLGELDKMALAGILSTQILFDNLIDFKKQSVPEDYQFKLFYDKRNKTLS